METILHHFLQQRFDNCMLHVSVSSRTFILILANGAVGASFVEWKQFCTTFFIVNIDMREYEGDLEYKVSWDALFVQVLRVTQVVHNCFHQP